MTLFKEMIFTEIKVENQSVFLDPPLENARLFCLSHLQSLISQICALPKVKYDVESKDVNFNDLMSKIDVQTLMEAYSAINQKLEKANDYFNGWKRYQTLWEIDINKVQDLLGTSTQPWEDMLKEILSGKDNIKSEQNFAYFGPISINFKIAKKKINNKYDGLHKEILNFFGKNINKEMVVFFEEIKNNRDKVESIDLMDSLNIISSISALNYCTENTENWKASIKKFQSGEQLLVTQSYYFPENWKQFSLLEAEWNRFEQGFLLKQKQYREEFDSIKARLLKEEDGMKKKVAEIEALWTNKKPFHPYRYRISSEHSNQM